VVVEEEGEARIREVYTVSATIAGKLGRITLHAGDTVVADKTIVAALGPAAPALLDARSRAIAQAGVAAASAAVDLARAQLAQAQATQMFMDTEARRAAQLFDKAALSERGLDSALLQQKTAVAAVDSARANLAVRGRELDSAKAALDPEGGGVVCCIDLTAPVSGQVLRVLTEDEQVVQTGTPIMEIGDPANLQVVVHLLSRDAVRVQAGAKAQITGWGGAPLAALVARVQPVAVPKTSALGIEERRVEVVLDLQGDPASWHLLGHGFRVIAAITVWRGEDVLAVPVGALMRDGADWAAYVVRGGRAQMQIITLGERDETMAQVLTGLASGDQVILHPSDSISSGTRVTQ
jgi:HlyD family secretion protein